MHAPLLLTSRLNYTEGMLQNILEKLQLKDEKNLLIQGLPSSIEKQFMKLAFAKNLTPLLKIRKIDFALVFALSGNQLRSILKEVLPALSDEAKFWIAHPKITSKIATDLNRDCSWECLRNEGYQPVDQVALDHVWTAVRFSRPEEVLEEVGIDELVSFNKVGTDVRSGTIPPSDFADVLRTHETAHSFFQTLSSTNKKEYVSWIAGAKREDTRSRRMEIALDKLLAGKRNPLEK